MLLEQRILNLKNISTSQKCIGEFILKEKYNIKDMSTRDIASATYTSPATIVQFSKKLGYKGFNDLKSDYLSELEYMNSHFNNIDANIPFNKNNTFYEISGKIKSLIKETIDDSYNLIDINNYNRALYYLNKADIVHIFGIGSNSLLAENFKYKMIRIGKKINIETRMSEYCFNLNTFSNNDCIILISYSGETESVINYAKLISNYNIPIIVITSIGDNTLKEYGNVTLNVSTREKQYSKIGSFSSDYSISFILDLLYCGYFSLDYDNNLKKKIELSKNIEKCRNPKSSIIKE